MASLVLDTGIPSHPQISIDSMDFARGQICFHWIEGPYSGDCVDQFALTLADHGEMTVNEVVAAISAQMISQIPA